MISGWALGSKLLGRVIWKGGTKESVPNVTCGNHTPISFSAMSQFRVLDVGGNEGERAYEFYPQTTDLRVVDIKYGWDVMEKGLPYGPWEVILANHFIEHIINPDYFLEECKRAMEPHTILDIGTPNLTAWFNRILFLFGYVPHSVELSTKFNVGKPFNWGKEPLGGHIRIFTLDALLELLDHHGFNVISVEGEASTYPTILPIRWLDSLLTYISPTLASAFRVKCTL